MPDPGGEMDEKGRKRTYGIVLDEQLILPMRPILSYPPEGGVAGPSEGGETGRELPFRALRILELV
jgi:hypothetical protein